MPSLRSRPIYDRDLLKAYFRLSPLLSIFVVEVRVAQVPVPAYIGVETVGFVQLSVGWYRELSGQSGLALSVPVVNHPEAVITAMAGKLQEVGSPHSEGRIIEENVLPVKNQQSK